MHRHRLLQTGLPYLVFALLLISGIVYIESLLLSRSDKIPVIYIHAGDDSFDNLLSIKTAPVNVSEKITRLIQGILTERSGITTIRGNSVVESLAKPEKMNLYIGLAQALYDKYDYNNVIKLLDLLTFQERLEHGVQFIYAYSLSKIPQWNKAIKQYQLLINYDAGSQAASLNLGLLFKKSERCSEAIPVFMQAVSISSGDRKAKALSNLASCNYALGQYYEAVRNYNKSIRYRPDAPHVWIMLANSIAATNSDYRQALIVFNKGVALNDQDYKTHLYKARFQMINYDYVGASSTLKIAQSLSDSLEIHELLTWAYLEQDMRTAAKKHLGYLINHATSKEKKLRAALLHLYADEHYQQLISELNKEERHSDEMLYLKGMASRKLGNYKIAFMIFNQLVDSKEFRWRSRIQQARVSRSRNQYSEAIKQYETLLGHNEAADPIWYESALIYEKQLNAAQGLININKAIELRPENYIYKLVQASLLDMSEQTPAAIAVLDAVLVRKPKYVRALRLMVELLIKEKDTGKLNRTYERLIEINENDYNTIYNLAKTLISGGENKAGQDLLVRLLEEQSDNIEARYLLAHSYYNSELLSDSLNEIENILRLEKNHPQAIMLKDTIHIKNVNKNKYRFE